MIKRYLLNIVTIICMTIHINSGAEDTGDRVLQDSGSLPQREGLVTAVNAIQHYQETLENINENQITLVLEILKEYLTIKDIARGLGYKSETPLNKMLTKHEETSSIDRRSTSSKILKKMIRLNNPQAQLGLNDNAFILFVSKLRNTFLSENQEEALLTAQEQNTLTSSTSKRSRDRDTSRSRERPLKPLLSDTNETNITQPRSTLPTPILSTPEIIKGTAYVSTDMAGLFSNEDFINSAVEEAHKWNLTALFHVQRILEMFSETSSDERYALAEAAGKRLETASEAVMSDTPHKQDWQSWYQRSIASVYLKKNAIEAINQALTFENMPSEYRKDLLRRAFNLNPDTKWADDGINHLFAEFYLLKASRPSNARPSTIAERIESRNASFSVLEEAIKHDISKAYFEIGKGVLRSEYKVPANSKIKSMNEFKDLKDKDLGLALVIYSLEQGVSPALTFLIDYYDEDRDEALKYCKLACSKWEQANNPFLSHAYFQTARILESQFKIKEAIESYKKAGPLVGYTDAARLAKPDLDRERSSEYTSEWFIQRKQEKENEILSRFCL